MMMLFVDKIVARASKGLCVVICFVCMVLSLFCRPYTEEELYIEGRISEYKEDVTHVSHWKGGDYDIECFYLMINNVKINVTVHEQVKFRGKESYWKNVLEGKKAKVHYRKSNHVYTSFETEDGSYSYHSSRDISYYNVGWFPFCITAPTALVCMFILFRYFFLLTFASDKTREVVFGDSNYNPFS